MLDADLRVDDDFDVTEIPAMDGEKVRLIAAAFARNKSEGTEAEALKPAVDKEKADAARQRMLELLNAAPSRTSGGDDRLSRGRISIEIRDIDAQIEQKLREIVRQTVQEMLGGETGQKLSSGIRRMVRREVEMMIALERAS